VTEIEWPSHNSSEIPSRTIAERKIVVCDINYSMVEDKWAESQSNHDAWVVTLLSKKSCACHKFNSW